MSHPTQLTPWKGTQYPLYRRLVGPQDHSEQVQKISPSPEFDPWTFHPVESQYTEYCFSENLFLHHATMGTCNVTDEI